MKRNYALALFHDTIGIGGVPRNENPFKVAYLTEKYGPEMTGEAEMQRLLDHTYVPRTGQPPCQRPGRARPKQI